MRRTKQNSEETPTSPRADHRTTQPIKVRALTRSYCKPCHRYFSSPGRLRQHLRSATHQRGNEKWKKREERKAEKIQKHKTMLRKELERPTTIEMPDWLALLHAAYPLHNVTDVAETASRYITIEGIDVLVWSSITHVLQFISAKVGIEPNLEGTKQQLGQMYLTHMGGA